jgi:hypothetical protein
VENCTYKIICREIALLEAYSALANVTVRCDKDPWRNSIHSAAVSGLHEVHPNALCSSHVGLSVSACRNRNPTVMRTHASLQCLHNLCIIPLSFRLRHGGISLVASGVVAWIVVAGSRKRRGELVLMKSPEDA